ncbi:BCCT family transporter [Halorhodospira halochloris]|uniref:Glycine betaine transporter OpuD n=1 Tax=Halorhodospira halochloris TaxID=1052 RepID=A0A0X8X9S3_HALHR|nr:BCCT family transporter [Halorhodospira halochloris]MBK1651251.1 choline transporter [Halorhodospira halochloris]MCG5530457.1 BCCT family transporter [Halorhodospira halochloris]MCG5548583.1 BCCT family transporter [Halorhodospira halochloris]BAU57528.1 glycine betaine transporter OpuD [Halorhodospira halochloris]
MRAQKGPLKGLNIPLTLMAVLVVGAFLGFGTYDPSYAEEVFNEAMEWVFNYFKWYYIGVVAFFLLFAIFLLISRFGDLKLGDDDRPPEFSYFAWFSMLFGAGMGIGLLFWSIAEPIYHFQSNPFAQEGEGKAAAETAMRLTYFHWGLHPWAIYAIVALALAFFCYRKKLPLAIRSALYPLIGQRIYGPIGHAADLLAVFGTIFGVATSLGLGAVQINTGLNELVGLEVGLNYQLAIIACVTAIAVGSVISGVGRGVKILSQLNLILSGIILLFFLSFGPTLYLLSSFVQGVGDYLQNVVYLSFWTDSSGARDADEWQLNWTAFYWGWWIAWAPFVGMFIARISRGRTIREFVLGVLLVPTLLAIGWLTVFGGTGLYQELFGAGGLVDAVSEDETIALYYTIEAVAPGVIATLAAVIATVLIATYFVTSSDSATLVITMLLSVGNTEPPTAQRAFWGVGEGCVAAVLLVAGGLVALQAAAIIAALPFSLIMLLMCYALVRGLQDEKNRMQMDWQPGRRPPGAPHL